MTTEDPSSLVATHEQVPDKMPYDFRGILGLPDGDEDLSPSEGKGGSSSGPDTTLDRFVTSQDQPQSTDQPLTRASQEVQNSSSEEIEPLSLIELVDREVNPKLNRKFGPRAKGARLNYAWFAAKFAWLHEGAIAYLPGESERKGSLYLYEKRDGTWRSPDPALLKGKLREFMIREMIGKKLKNVDGLFAIPDAKLQEMLETVRYESRQENWRWGCERSLIHFQNCMFDVDTGEMLHHDSKYRSRHALPHEWNSAASHCPRFMGLISGGDAGDADAQLILAYIGMCLLGKNRYQRMLLLTGLGGTGKGAMTEIIQGLVGADQFVELRTDKLKGNFESGSYIGKTLLCGADTAADFLACEGGKYLKAMVGRDAVTGESKNVNARTTARGEWNILLSTNESLELRINSDDDRVAWGRRLLVVNFSRRSFEKPQWDFAHAVLCDEAPAIIARSVKAFSELIARGGDWALTDLQQGLINNILDRSAGIAGWAARNLALAPDDNVAVSECWDKFSEWCKRKDKNPGCTRAFQRSLKEWLKNAYGVSQSNHIRRDGNECRGYQGIQLVCPGVTERK